MRSMIKLAAMAALGIGVLGLGAGCTVVPAVAVSPGYYYDDAYVDVYGVYHPRLYWYYNGYRWDRRYWAPHGYYYARPRGYYRRW